MNTVYFNTAHTKAIPICSSNASMYSSSLGFGQTGEDNKRANGHYTKSSRID